MLCSKNIKFGVIVVWMCTMLSGCDVVKLDQDGKPILPMSAEDAASIKNMTPKDIAEKLWGQIVPEAKQKSITWEKIKSEVTTAKSGKNKSYFVSFEGVVDALDTSTKERSIKINVAGDNVSLQLGPIVKGNAIRDAASFIQFDQFKNQVQFAKLSKELNKKALLGISMPDAAWQGKSVDVLAAATISDNGVVDIIPIEIIKR
ncbi:putative lipoprotein [Tolumonas auensis DSM 9187]|uniref:Putative lipoprotein n=1 Tax=Tolumonas auensis (strain DSM 9187 / NBRC 110442 / TA 4) TaxID=595494 RepID=C4LFS7_TOLAT|nr:DUF2291 family protein [Tolumonas auensis]ACQ93444.1 putative lipoprotein [Tolumonas auensis DSM 9187]